MVYSPTHTMSQWDSLHSTNSRNSRGYWLASPASNIDKGGSQLLRIGVLIVDGRNQLLTA